MEMEKIIYAPLEGYKETKANELQCHKLNERDEKRIKKYVIGNNLEVAWEIILILGIFGAFEWVSWVSSKNSGEADSSLVLFFIFGLAFVMLTLSKVILNTRYKKAQVGVLQGVMWQFGTSEDTPRNVYLDVIFPDSKTRIRGVLISYNLAQKAKKGDKILVVSFNGKKAYGFLCDD